MKALRKFLRNLVLTAAERTVLERDARQNREMQDERLQIMQRTLELHRQFEREDRADHLAQSLRLAFLQPQRWMPDPEISASEATQWGNVITGPLGVKIDTAMINWCQQQAQAACAAPAEQIIAAAGFARGCVVSWQMAKTLSRIANANVGTTETDPDTAKAGLEQHQP